MSLKTSQSIQFTGTSTVGDKQVATFATNIAAGQTYSNVSMNISDQATYDANKAEVRSDRDDFQDQADKLQDNLDTPADDSVSDSSASSAAASSTASGASSAAN
ncbi:hypothetical protein N6G96_05955 [Pediococcus inopinatus]|uniref:Extracellular protein n=1 Tax=Pediococcus inopinatus TaxID=114090 RepID=A0ABZ0Q401_9LACO|nr:hypothetical protein [Pediococcus inopinatus]WPC20852.1 hypothetical protein N6G96_05955 [Pediococcus inopinatus]